MVAVAELQLLELQEVHPLLELVETVETVQECQLVLVHQVCRVVDFNFLPVVQAEETITLLVVLQELEEKVVVEMDK
tara:strand:- start:171 stop:401 length:231 start_codon:yes stop_codon:yes gene_type:complete